MIREAVFYQPHNVGGVLRPELGMLDINPSGS